MLNIYRTIKLTSTSLGLLLLAACGEDNASSTEASPAAASAASAYTAKLALSEMEFVDLNFGERWVNNSGKVAIFSGSVQLRCHRQTAVAFRMSLDGQFNEAAENVFNVGWWFLKDNGTDIPETRRFFGQATVPPGGAIEIIHRDDVTDPECYNVNGHLFMESNMNKVQYLDVVLEPVLN